MTREEKISSSLKANWAAKPRGIGLAALKAAAKPGECICCGDPAEPLSDYPEAVAKRKQLGTTRTHRDTCGDEICRKARHRYWRRDYRA